ncbi:MAG: S9 family peptidase [Calditrichia bacterium]
MINLKNLTALLIFSAIAMLVFSCARPQPKIIPRKVLFGNPAKTNPHISPDGSQIAYLAPVKGALNIWVKTLLEDDDHAVTQDTLSGIHRYIWAQDSKHILFLRSGNGNEKRQLYGVNIESLEEREYTPFPNVQVRILATSKFFPDEILIEMNKENPGLHDVYMLNLTSGDYHMVARNPGNVISWLADADFKVRAAVASDPDGGTELLIRKDEQSTWKSILTWSPENSFISGPVSFSRGGDSLYMIDSRGYNTAGLVLMDVASRDTTVIFRNPDYDVGDVMINPDSYKAEAVSYISARRNWVPLDPKIATDFDIISHLDFGDYIIYDRDAEDDVWLIGFTKDIGPVSYYTINRERDEVEYLFDQQPNLKRHALARMDSITYTARDGLPIRGYITYPVWKKHKKLPLILDVHGGPWTRNTWGYDPDAQWMANRGYICLQVNYRGSTGYGKKFLNAGNKEWGGKMYTDLVDAVNWAVQQGYANPRRIAIYGESYGGYAALMGAAKNPALYRCAVDIMGPTNLVSLIRSIPPYWTPYLAALNERVGNPETEIEFLRSRSPIFNADSIRIPVLIAQGENDPHVHRTETEKMVEALKEKGVKVEYLLFPNEGHGLTRPENRLKFYSDAEKFLSRYLGGRYEE